MSAYLRLALLTNVARLRAAGLVPWLLLPGWLLFAALQEPVLLRRYGVHVIEEAAWVGGLAVLIVLLLTESRLPRRAAWLANLLLLVAVSLTTAIGAACVGFVREPEPGRLPAQAAYFVLAWAPLTLVASRPGGRSRAASITVILASFLLGCAHSIALRSSEPFHGVLACALAATAASVWAVRT